ncbi:alpha/beta hydrolase [Streptomyces spiramenti]|uniref:Alpha/beta fold hydrolase n=1 Tax=Streptomyces spiramenti TaxID=2720606 RepID=A0ABX1AV69_9ACTN|nr:alpha/beta hydrolase [Streptomyces spiramenti]NJP68297.1 alpha/beta fold hydrolase [Streptomyces spiramenti]
MSARSTVRRGAALRAAAAVTAALGVLTSCAASGADSGDEEPEIAGVPSPSVAGEAGPLPGDEDAAPPEAPSLPPLPAGLLDQQPDWRPCPAPTEAQGGGAAPGDGWQCAGLTVPVDYSAPEGRTMELALVRSRAEGDRRIGSLVLNFGGPGGSGVATLPRLEQRFTSLAGAFDLVSMDPRGVGASDGVVCFTGEERDAMLAGISHPRGADGAAGEDAYLDDRLAYAERCAQEAGDLLPHLTTANTARDLDVLREVLGEPRLHYYGASYGTKLGAVHAALFPDRVGRVVLDSVVDPTVDVVGRALGQTAGFQQALDAYLTDCAAAGDCPAGDDPARAHLFLGELLDSLADRPLPTAGGRQLTQNLAVTGVIGSLYSEGSWPRLTRALREAHTEGRGDLLLAAADRYNGRGQQGGYRNLHDANVAVNCADFATRPDLATVREQRAAFEEASPVLGRFLVWELLGCAGWPVVSEQDQPAVAVEGTSRTILLVAVTGDPATPYRGAERMREALGEGTAALLTLDGEGHGAYTGGDPCVTAAVDAHLLTGKTPADGTTCG